MATSAWCETAADQGAPPSLPCHPRVVTFDQAVPPRAAQRIDEDEIVGVALLML